MALTEPFDFLAEWPGWTTRFELLFRQEQSRDAGGRTYVKDFGSPLWRMAAQSKTLKPNLIDHWRARLDALENGLMTFYGYALARTYPILYPNGSWPTGVAFSGTSAAVHVVGANNKSLRLKALPAGFQLSVGDMIQIGDADLHRVMEPATADGTGETPAFFEVRPHLWPGVAIDDVVSVKRPHCLMAIVPGSIQTQTDLSGRGSVSFEAMEAR
jgi:hypothetical protein